MFSFICLNIDTMTGSEIYIQYEDVQAFQLSMCLWHTISRTQTPDRNTGWRVHELSQMDSFRNRYEVLQYILEQNMYNAVLLLSWRINLSARSWSRRDGCRGPYSYPGFDLQEVLRVKNTRLINRLSYHQFRVFRLISPQLSILLPGIS